MFISCLISQILEIVPFVKIFERLDGERKGVITIEDLLKMIDTSRSLFTDTLCEVLEVDMSGHGILNTVKHQL